VKKTLLKNRNPNQGSLENRGGEGWGRWEKGFEETEKRENKRGQKAGRVE